MSIGATLAAARRHAGLSVAEVSQRTRVRENIIEGIEQDDYAACGGDFYARGHIRAIAEAVGTDPGPLIEEFDERWRSAQEITAAEAFQPMMPIRKRERRRVRWTAVLAVLVLAVIGFAGYKFASGVGKTQRAADATTQRPTHRPSPVPSITPSVQASTAQSGPTATPSASPVAAQALTPARVTAFGPAGTADGDDPQRASFAISGHAATPWYSDWYATSDFGHLQAGTGLLVDMGATVTISSVRLSLGGHAGATVQVRAGSRPVLADLRTVATSAGPGSIVELTLTSPAHARYLLIWFTKLPLDDAGTYQASIYAITVQGLR
ncbi:MAG: helix-turn-helix domain-containing protein [Streptosporangiaceae bacterium]